MNGPASNMAVVRTRREPLCFFEGRAAAPYTSTSDVALSADRCNDQLQVPILQFQPARRHNICRPPCAGIYQPVTH